MSRTKVSLPVRWGKLGGWGLRQLDVFVFFGVFRALFQELFDLSEPHTHSSI